MSSTPKEEAESITNSEAPLAKTAQADENNSREISGASLSASADDTAKAPAEKEEQSKRFIPDHKKPDAALTFPEKLMNLMKIAEKEDTETFCVAWLADGKSFVIRNPDEFTRKVLPKFFKATKFSSFTRKLYRWGFRQVNRGIGPDDPIIFGNEFFQRDNLELMAKMRSVTAASTRKQEQNNMQMLAQKRALETMDAEQNHKRVLLDQIMQQKASMNAGFFPNSGINLTQALRPNPTAFAGMGAVKPFDMLQHMNSANSLMSAFPPTGLGGLAQAQNGQAFGPAPSTADIVNAAINALRYAP